MNFFNEEIKNLTVKNLRQDKNDWLIDIEFAISNGIDTYKGTIKNIILCSANSRIKSETKEQTIKDMNDNNLATYLTDALLNIDENTFKFKKCRYHNLCDLERIAQ